MKYFDKNSRNGTTRTHDISPSNILLFIYTKLKENVHNYNIDNNNINNNNNTCSCLECGETPTKKEKKEKIKQNTRQNNN